jgi:hypothetical protein
MDDRIGRRAANAGVDQTAAEMAVAIIPQLLSKQGLSDKVSAVGAHMPRRRLAMLPSPAPRMHDAADHRVCRRTRIAATRPSAPRVPSFARSSMCFAREIQGNMQPARPLARSPSSASSSGV